MVPPAPVPPCSYSAVLWATLLDLAVYHDAPSPLGLLGAALVCASSFFLVYYEQRGGGGVSGSGRPPLKAKDSGRALGADASLELAEAGGSGARPKAAGVRWGSAADEAAGPQAQQEDLADERAPLVGQAQGSALNA